MASLQEQNGSYRVLFCHHGKLHVPPDGGGILDDARKQLVEVLGGPFVIFRDKVQEELKLADAQKQKPQVPGRRSSERIHEVFSRRLGHESQVTLSRDGFRVLGNPKLQRARPAAFRNASSEPPRSCKAAGGPG